VLVVLVVLLSRSRLDAARLGAGWLWAGVALALVGQALRFYTLSWVSDGTSGQDDVLEAKTLNTQGPYAHVRNPLYVGNWLICLGLMVFAKDGWAGLLGTVFFFGEYFFIIRAEEAFLRSQFGDTYRAYCEKVPRWWPRMTPAFGGPLRQGVLDWRRGLKKEHNPFTAWALGCVVLWAWETWAWGGRLEQIYLGFAFAAALLVLFAGVKAWKRRWIFAR
jgi:protein-S-isoprenylcysteine O-methyltransferase Ste14